MANIVLRLPSGAEMPINLDYEQQLSSFLHARLPCEDILFARHQPRPPINPLTCDNSPEILTPPYPPLPPIAVNELQWPTGASRYGRALYLVDGPTMRAIAIECFGWEDPEPPGPEDPPVDNINIEIPSLWGQKQYQLEVAIFGEQLFRAKMFCLPPYRVPGTAMNLFLLPLVDRRFYDLGGVHPPTETAPESIDTLIDDLAGEMDFQLTISKDAIPADYGTKVDARLHNTTVPQPASNLLDVAALSIGMRVILEPMTNAYRMINAENSSNRRNSRLGYTVSVIEGETFVEGETSATLVAGGKRGRAALPPRLSVWVIKDGEPFERLSDPFTDGATVGVPNYPVWTTWAETASNTAATDAFVEQLSADMAEWSNSGGQYCFAGAIQYLPCGFDDYLSIQFLEVAGDDGELEPVLRSRVYELPSMFGPVVFLVGGDLEECGGGAIQYAYPPSTGIPAATFNATTKKTKPGTALCTIAVEDTPGVFKPGTETLIVENQVGSAVGLSGRMMTIALNDTSGRWEVIVEDCTAGSTGGGNSSNPDNPVPVPSPDPINEGTSKSFSLGYFLGV